MAAAPSSTAPPGGQAADTAPPSRPFAQKGLAPLVPAGGLRVRGAPLWRLPLIRWYVSEGPGAKEPALPHAGPVLVSIRVAGAAGWRDGSSPVDSPLSTGR